MAGYRWAVGKVSEVSGAQQQGYQNGTLLNGTNHKSTKTFVPLVLSHRKTNENQ